MAELTASQQQKINRDAYIYNTVGGLLMAFQSVLLLIVITRVGDLAMAGVFTIAYANANLFLNIGKYGMRNFQASDVSQTFSFSSYRASRLATSLAMVAVSAAYLLYCATTVGYTLDKTLVIFVMCLFKVVDAVEDVYHGDYQRVGRLDVAAKVFTWRMATTIILFIALLIATGNLLISLCLSTAFTTLFFIVSVIAVKRRFSFPPQSQASSLRDVLALLKECLPLFLGAFLLFYIGNAPKYAIDAFMTDEAQALYGFISMPVFVVGLLSSFVYNPIISKLAHDWTQANIPSFLKEVTKQCVAVLVLTAICLAGTWLIGIPVLSILYNTNLSPYLVDLLILVAGGGFYAFIGLFMAVITVIRFQKSLVSGFAVVSAVAAVASPWIVQSFGIRGASWEYFILMGALAVLFAVLLALGIATKRPASHQSKR